MDQAPYLLGTKVCYLPVELSPCSKGSQGEGEVAVIAHQPASQGIEPGITESVDREESPEPPASPSRWLKVKGLFSDCHSSGS